LRKIIKDAILIRIRDKLYYSKKDLSTFEDLKQAVLKIDNDHWKYTQDKQSKQYLVCSLQTHQPRLSRPDYFYPSASDGKTPAEWPFTSKPQPLVPMPTTQVPPASSQSIASYFGPDGKFMAIEQHRHMSFGLLAQDCKDLRLNWGSCSERTQ